MTKREPRQSQHVSETTRVRGDRYVGYLQVELSLQSIEQASRQGREAGVMHPPGSETTGTKCQRCSCGYGECGRAIYTHSIMLGPLSVNREITTLMTHTWNVVRRLEKAPVHRHVCDIYDESFNGRKSSSHDVLPYRVRPGLIGHFPPRHALEAAYSQGEDLHAFFRVHLPLTTMP